MSHIYNIHTVKPVLSSTKNGFQYRLVLNAGQGEHSAILSSCIKLPNDFKTFAVIHLQLWAYGSWDSLFPISMSPNCKLLSPKHYF